MIDHQIRLATGSGHGSRVKKGVGAWYFQALEHRDVTQRRAGELRYLGTGSAFERMSVDHAHVSAFQAHVGATETKQEQREKQDSADNQQDLEAFQRWFSHRRGRQRGYSADGNQIRTGCMRFWTRLQTSTLDAAELAVHAAYLIPIRMRN